MSKYNLFRNHSYIFQKEEYNVSRYLSYLLKSPIPINAEKVDKLRLTPKMYWIIVASLIEVILSWSIIYMLTNHNPLSLLWGISYVVFFPFYIILGLYTKKPIEVLNKQIVIKKCRKRILALKKNGLKVIAITGSYGKTTTKTFIKQLLEKKYKVYATPKSYNTLFGIAQPTFKLEVVKSVLDYLSNDVEYFIVEMGAYSLNDIKILTDAFPPDMSVLTGISSVHLERFKTLDKIIKAKTELIRKTPKGNKIFLNISNKYIKSIARKYENDYQILTYSDKDSNAKLYGRITQATPHKTTIEINCSNRQDTLTTSIIGKGNILNLCGAMLVALECSVDIDNISNSVSNMLNIESRMQLIDDGTGILLINNGYSSNFMSFKQSIATLEMFENYYKVLVTPGIFEAGKKTYDLHYKLGKKITKSIDLVILLTGKNNIQQIEGLLEGMKSSNYPQEKITKISKIEDFMFVVKRKNLVPCVVLFENDLPDIYNT